MIRLKDSLALPLSAIVGQKLRSGLTILGIAVGIAAVILLTSLGEGIHRFVLSQFTQFGTNLIAVTPGKTNTAGMSGAVINNIRPLSLEDAESLGKLPHIEAMVATVSGNGPVEAGGKTRHVNILGVGPEALRAWQMKVSLGRFLPPDDPRAARALVVLGPKVRSELLGTTNPLGKKVRIGGERYIVIGEMESKGQLLGFDLDDSVYIPVGRALAMFNRESLMEIDLLYNENIPSKTIAELAKKRLIARHGREDFTITSQEQMLEVLGSILEILTLGVAAIGSISLFVGGVGILTIMTIGVQERTGEIGLLRALGATKNQLLLLFLAEALLLGACGGICGLAIGAGGAWLLSTVIPALPTHTSLFYAVTAELLAICIGLLAGIIPAKRAAGLDPIEALRAE